MRNEPWFAMTSMRLLYKTSVDGNQGHVILSTVSQGGKKGNKKKKKLDVNAGFR